MSWLSKWTRSGGEANGYPKERGRTHVSEKSDAYRDYHTLADFGYELDDRGRLRHLRDHGPFRFEGQAHYEALGRVVTKLVYNKLEEEGLRQRQLKGGAGFFYASPNAETAPVLLLLVHGAGQVRAGQWSRRLIINESLDAGSMLPAIRKARELGWAVACLNTNQTEDAEGFPIIGSESPERHGVTVWKDFVRGWPATQIGIIAHSAGGGVIADVANRNAEDFRYRVRAVALADAFCPPGSLLERVRVHHWVCSSQPLDAPLGYRPGQTLLSAGTERHEAATTVAFKSIFAFLRQNLGQQPPLIQFGHSPSHNDFGEPVRPHSAFTPVHHAPFAPSVEKEAYKRPRRASTVEDASPRFDELCGDSTWQRSHSGTRQLGTPGYGHTSSYGGMSSHKAHDRGAAAATTVVGNHGWDAISKGLQSPGREASAAATRSRTAHAQPPLTTPFATHESEGRVVQTGEYFH